MEYRSLGEDLERGVRHADTGTKDRRQANTRADRLAGEARDGRVELV